MSAALLCGALPTAFAGYENFTPKTTYTDGRFSDVSSSDWFYENVRASYEYDLINGYNDGKFHPNENLTIAQAIKLAACLNSLYSSGTADFASSTPWYQTYVDYAQRNGILTRTFADYDAHASRREFAAVLAGRSRARAPAHQQYRGRRDPGCSRLGRGRGRDLFALPCRCADRLERRPVQAGRYHPPQRSGRHPDAHGGAEPATEGRDQHGRAAGKCAFGERDPREMRPGGVQTDELRCARQPARHGQRRGALRKRRRRHLRPSGQRRGASRCGNGGRQQARGQHLRARCRLRHRAYPRRRRRSAVSGDRGQPVHGRHRVRARLSGRRRGKR